MNTYLRGAMVALGSLALPLLTFAANPANDAAKQAAGFVDTFNRVILYPTITLLSAVAFLVFLWGAAQYFLNAANDQARQQGVKHMTYGFIGLTVMITAFTILTIAAATFGLDDELRCADDPSASGCTNAFEISP